MPEAKASLMLGWRELEADAEQLVALKEKLQQIHPVFSTWRKTARTKKSAMLAIVATVQDFQKDLEKREIEKEGVITSYWNEDETLSFQIRLKLGFMSSHFPWRQMGPLDVMNSISIDASFKDKPLADFRLLLTLCQIVVECLAPLRGVVVSSDITRLVHSSDKKFIGYTGYAVYASNPYFERILARLPDFSSLPVGDRGGFVLPVNDYGVDPADPVDEQRLRALGEVAWEVLHPGEETAR